MKQLLSMVVIAGTFAIITFSSCTKEDPSDCALFHRPVIHPPPPATCES